MEASVGKSSSKRRLKKKRRQRELKEFGKGSELPSRTLGIKKPTTRKENRKNTDKIHLYLGSLIQDICEERMSPSSSLNKSRARNEHIRMNLLDQTIDLCDADSSIDFNSNVSVQPSSEVHEISKPVIDLCQDLTDRNEIIDLTETVSVSRVRNSGSGNSGSEPTVIDLSEEDSRDEHEHHSKAENDEIFVIGTFSKNSNITRKNELPSFISLSNRWNNFNSFISYKEKVKKNFKKRLVLDKIDNKNNCKSKKDFWGAREKSKKIAKVAKVGENIYVNSPVTLPSKGLRPIIIDGSNVAFVRSSCNFSCKRLEICINYFKEKGHKVTAFVPQFRLKSRRSDDPQLLRRLERQGDVILTPSKKVDGRTIVPYDDRFIVQTAVLKGGIIVSRDNFNDLLKENPAWAETIKYRTLAFTWVDDVLMFPKDPLGEHGPSLEDFLSFH